jgi:hypothetical protein
VPEGLRLQSQRMTSGRFSDLAAVGACLLLFVPLARILLGGFDGGTYLAVCFCGVLV